MLLMFLLIASGFPRPTPPRRWTWRTATPSKSLPSKRVDSRTRVGSNSHLPEVGLCQDYSTWKLKSDFDKTRSQVWKQKGMFNQMYKKPMTFSNLWRCDLHLALTSDCRGSRSTCSCSVWHISTIGPNGRDLLIENFPRRFFQSLCLN